MSLIELIVEEILSKHILISNDNPELFIYNKLKLREVLEKYLKQSENKLIDDLIEKRIPVLENLSIQEQSITILKNQFREDLEILKQSEKVVEIKIQWEWMYQHWMCSCYCTVPYKCNYCHSCWAKIKWID